MNSRANLAKGVGKGRTLRDIWREQGFPEEEVEQKYQARIDLIKTVKFRKHVLRKEAEAATFGLGEHVNVALAIGDTRKNLSREFKLAPQKGQQSQTTILKRQQARQKAEDLARQRAFNPRVRGLAGIEGVEVAADGSIGLEDLRKQRPDIFDMKPMLPAGKSPNSRMAKINELKRSIGQKDDYYDRIVGS